MKIKFLLIAVFSIQLTAIYSQNAKQALQDIWQEKTEWRFKAAEINQQSPAANGNERGNSDSNLVVSSTSDIQSEVHAAINPLDSNSIAVSSNFVDLTALFPRQTNYIYYTNDFGQTWQQSPFVTGPAQSPSYILGGGDPNFVYTDQGKLYFSWINLWTDVNFNTWFNLYFATSTDGGNVWSRDSVSDLIGSASSSLIGSGGAFDKEWLATDKTPSSPYYGNLYSSFFQVNADSNQEFIGVRRKVASLGYFDTVSAQANTATYQFIQFSSIAVDRNGGVHVTFFGSLDSITYSLYHALSTDGGLTFQPETKISDVSLGRYSQGQQSEGITGIDSTRLYPSAYIACDNTGSAYNNNLYMVWTADGITSKLNFGNDIYLSISTNGGSNWSTPRILNDNSTNLTSDQYYPDITVSPTGRVMVTWWDRRNDTANLKSDIYLTYSDDGGQTFIPDMKVTTVPTDFSTVGEQNGGFGIGEYNVVLATQSYAIPMWADGRSDNGQLNIYAAFTYLGTGQATGVQNITAINGPLKIYAVYPDPAKDELNLSYETSQSGKLDLSVYDVQGKLVLPLGEMQTEAIKGTVPLNISKLAAGTYLLKVIFNGTVNVRRFVKAGN